MGMSLKDTAIYTKNKYNLPDSVDQILQEWHEIYEEIIKNDVRLFPGTVQLFQYLKSFNIKIGIASACPRKLILSVLNNSGKQIETPVSKDTQTTNQINIIDYIDDIETCDELNRNKPDPFVFDECIRKLGIEDKQKVIIFEDSATGLKAAKAAHVKSVICHLSDSHNREQRIQLSDYQINSLIEII